MATVAAVIDARLEKPGVYVLNPDGALPSVETARSGIRVAGLAGLLAFVFAGLLAYALAGLVAGVGAWTAPTPASGVVVWF
jgi:adenosylcobinamide-phosphate synthase